MKGTIYGNMQPRGTEVEKGWEPLHWSSALQDDEMEMTWKMRIVS
jgi:hypothetical protein